MWKILDVCVVRQSQVFVEVVPYEKKCNLLGEASVRLRDKAIWVAQSSVWSWWDHPVPSNDAATHNGARTGITV